MTDQPQPNPDVLRILEERARALARPPATAVDGASVELVVLVLGDERYGVEIAQVREIRPLSGLTRVPGAPRVWAGVVNLRGHLYAILDLRRYLELPAANRAEPGSVVLIAAAGLEVGLLVDEVAGIRRVPRDTIVPPLDGGARRPLVRGMTPDMLVLLDLESLLDDPRLVVYEEVNT